MRYANLSSRATTPRRCTRRTRWGNGDCFPRAAARLSRSSWFSAFFRASRHYPPHLRLRRRGVGAHPGEYGLAAEPEQRRGDPPTRPTPATPRGITSRRCRESRAWKVRLKARTEIVRAGAEHLEAGEALSCSSTRSRGSDLTAGRVIEKWGTGYAWNPTGGLGPAEETEPIRTTGARPYRSIKEDQGRPLRPRHERLALRAQTQRRRPRLPPRARHRHLPRHAARSRRRAGGDRRGTSLRRCARAARRTVERRRVVIGGPYTFGGELNVVAEFVDCGLRVGPRDALRLRPRRER